MLQHPHPLLTLQHGTKRHSRLPTEPPWVLSACSYILSLIHYQWGCSRKCCLITSHTGLRSLWSFGGNSSLSVYLNPTVQDHWGILSQGGFLLSTWPRFDLISCLHDGTNLIFALFLCKSSKQHLHLSMLLPVFSLLFIQHLKKYIIITCNQNLMQFLFKVIGRSWYRQ